MPVFEFRDSSSNESSNESSNATHQLVALDQGHAERILRRRGLNAMPRIVDGPSVDVVQTGAEMRELLNESRRRGQVTGLVPTMGALHAGHVSLVEASCRETDFTVATIFVNPTQFGPDEDYQRYPRTLTEDLERLEQAGANACFVPAVEEMYPAGCTTSVKPSTVAARWEGDCRPGHFEGVATIVLKLLNVAPVDAAFFGSKDYQQALVIRQMVDDLLLATRIHTCPIVREPDGLALSSRNRYLSKAERDVAMAVPQAWRSALAALESGEDDPTELSSLMHRVLRDGGVDKVDYAVVVDADTLEPLDRVNRPAVALIAAFVGSTRLIDNCLLTSCPR